MDTEQILDDDAILGGDGATDALSDDDAILGDTQPAAPEPQVEAAPEPVQPTEPQQPAVTAPVVDDRQQFAWSEMNRKLQQAQYELDQLRQQQTQAQQQVDAGLLGDEELGFINKQLSERDAFWQSQITQMQSQQSIQFAQMQAEMNREQTGGWSKTLELAREEALRQAPIYGVTPEQLFQAIDTAPDAGQRIAALAQMARERSAASQPVDVEKIKQDAYQQALKDFQQKAAASPHNLAPPTVGSIPAVTVTQPRVLSDEEILAQ
jgi:hypothetical protein